MPPRRSWHSSLPPSMQHLKLLFSSHRISRSVSLSSSPPSLAPCPQASPSRTADASSSTSPAGATTCHIPSPNSSTATPCPIPAPKSTTGPAARCPIPPPRRMRQSTPPTSFLCSPSSLIPLIVSGSSTPVRPFRRAPCPGARNSSPSISLPTRSSRPSRSHPPSRAPQAISTTFASTSPREPLLPPEQFTASPTSLTPPARGPTPSSSSISQRVRLSVVLTITPAHDPTQAL